MSRVSAILLAAGKGLRFKSKISKPLVKVNSQPVINYSLRVLSSCPGIKEIIVVANDSNLKALSDKIEMLGIKKSVKIVRGGKRRQDSVLNGILAVDDRADTVLIHDSARPFITPEIVASVLKEANKTGSAIVGVPVKATIKEVKGYFVKGTLKRDSLWEIQTPQVFKKSLILKAYKKFANIGVTDDASLVEKCGNKVKLVMGSYFNIKITTPEDLVLAEAIAKEYN